MPETIIGVFPNAESAHQAVLMLHKLGVEKYRIGYVTSDVDTHKSIGNVKYDIIAGIESGAVAGGATGFLLGLTAFAIPFATPIVAAGTFAAAIAGGGVGAVAGGLIGFFTSHGLPAEVAERMAHHVNFGGTIITVHVDQQDAMDVKDVIEQFGGSTKVDDIPDAGTIPSDPLHFTSDTQDIRVDEDPLSELGASRQSRP